MSLNVFEKLESCKTLPTLPAVATEIVRLSREEEVDLQALSRIVATDPVIASKLLSTANSAIFLTRGGAPTTVKQAVLRLGANTVMTLALSFALTRLRGSASRVDQSRFWKRALASATAARVIAERSQCDPEEAFLAGLFQDIGVLALNEVMGPTYGDLLTSTQDDHLRLERMERELFDIGHREAGAWLAEKWKLPSYLVHTTRNSHNPVSLQPTTAFAELTRAVALSSFVAEIWVGNDREEATKQAAECARMWLGMDAESFTKTLQRVAGAMPELSRLFEIPIDPAAVSSGLDEAREALVRVSLRSAQVAFEAETTVTQLSKQKAEIELQAQRDALTGLFNRGHFDEQLEKAFESARESGRPLSLVFIDVDHFKDVNDKHGHPAGDAVLQNLGRLIARCMRQLDIPTRYGGEEFAIILPGTDRSGVNIAAERLRKLLEKQETTIKGGRSLQITASFGCATMDATFRPDDPLELVLAADGALYRAKDAGRNRVVSRED